MCQECGCGNLKEAKAVDVHVSVHAVNDAIAASNDAFFRSKQIFCVNILGAPGSGKTTLIEGLIKELGSSSVAVIQGDLESDVDKVRLEKLGVRVYQINTHSGCHLQAQMINTALLNMDLSSVKYLLIENVGNLVCPAGVKLGQHMNIVLSPVTEGHDKPVKYPIIFLDAHLVLLTKWNLASAVEFDYEAYMAGLQSVTKSVKVMKVGNEFAEVSARIAHWRDHLYEIPHVHKK